MRRDDDNYTVRPTWDNVLGMRATCSDDTVLEGVFVPDERIARVVPTGFAGIDGFVLGIFAWALMGFGNIYHGLARRVFDLTVSRLGRKSSIAMGGAGMARHAGIQRDIADMAIELEGIAPHLDLVAREWSMGVNHGPMWGPKIVMAKHRAVESAWRVVDRALDVSGGFGIFPASGIERLVRDARIGRLHPANGYLTREIVAKAALGLDLDAQPRWG
jgi:alkylation response protein AidB-like acyl-CoA dehydrogenase